MLIGYKLNEYRFTRTQIYKRAHTASKTTFFTPFAHRHRTHRFQLPWRLNIRVRASCCKSNDSGKSYRKTGNFVPFFVRWKWKKDEVDRGMVRPDIKTDVQLRAILIAECNHLSFFKRHTTLHTYRYTYIFTRNTTMDSQD